MQVKDLMSTDVYYANPDSSLSQIAATMKQLDVGSIPVCDQSNHTLGIVTDRDIVLRGVAGGNINMSAQDIMTNNLVYATPDMHAHEAADLMSQNQVRRLPVVDNGQLVGMVSIGDLATTDIYENEAGDALSDISEPSNPRI